MWITYHPFLPFHEKDKLAKRLYDIFKKLEIPWKELYESVDLSVERV